MTKKQLKQPARVIRHTILFAILATALPAFAASQAQLPPEQKEGAVTFRSGGVGQAQAKAMEAIAKRYPLELEFIKKVGGHEGFLAGVDVSIMGKGGKQILETKTDGPFLLAKLPAGRYTVMAKNNDVKRERHIAVPAHGTKRVVIGW